MSLARQGQLKSQILRHAPVEGLLETAIPGFGIYSTVTAKIKSPTVYKPSVCVVVQGMKKAFLEEVTYTYGTADYLAVSIDLPLIAQVLEASEAMPFVSMQIDLEPSLISDLVTQMEDRPFLGKGPQMGLFVGQLDELLGDCLLRMARLLDSPGDIAVMAPLLTREFHFRLLVGEHGPGIAQLASQGSKMQMIAKAIRVMKADISQPVRIENLAEMAHMSPSSFHAHFKKVTMMSPLQYYKRLRLTTARHILLSEGTDATSTAYRVGYESPSQFSREYARMFGAPPMRDMEEMRSARPVASRSHSGD